MKENEVGKLLGVIIVSFILVNNSISAQSEIGLKDALDGKFLIGTALNPRYFMGRDTDGVEIVKKHFNAIVAENSMKSEKLQPVEGQFNWERADKFVEFGVENNLTITGHTLIWHSQLPRWFCRDENGEDVAPDILKKRMETHIKTVVGRYKGKVKGWDVVNEAINDDGSFRESAFYRILGPEFIDLAFQYAHEADPDVELYYNDYSMNKPGKREGVVKLIKHLKSKGIRIDAVGMQSHCGMNFPSIDEYVASIEAFAAIDVKLMITELDITALPRRRQGADISNNMQFQQEMNPYSEGLPDSVSVAWNNRMMEFFDIYLKYSDVIDRVTLWGVTDGDSWLNNWPMRGRTDYALLFDREYQPKPVVDLIIKKTQEK